MFYTSSLSLRGPDARESKNIGTVHNYSKTTLLYYSNYILYSGPTHPSYLLAHYHHSSYYHHSKKKKKKKKRPHPLVPRPASQFQGLSDPAGTSTCLLLVGKGREGKGRESREG